MTATAARLTYTVDWHAPGQVRLITATRTYDLSVDLRPSAPGLTDHIVTGNGTPIGYLLDLPDRVTWQPVSIDGDLLVPRALSSDGYMALVAHYLDTLNGAI